MHLFLLATVKNFVQLRDLFTGNQIMETNPKKGQNIWDPITLPCGITLKNRIAKVFLILIPCLVQSMFVLTLLLHGQAALSECIADPAINSPNEQHVELYSQWGRCGAGMLITGNVMVDARYLESPGNVVVEDDNHLATLQRWAKAGRCEGSAIVVQISHPGRILPAYP